MTQDGPDIWKGLPFLVGSVFVLFALMTAMCFLSKEWETKDGELDDVNRGLLSDKDLDEENPYVSRGVLKVCFTT